MYMQISLKSTHLRWIENTEGQHGMSDIIYLKMRGDRQGDISSGCGTKDSVGNRFQQGHEHEIFAFSLSNSITGTGKGINLQGLNFSKLIDKSTPLLGSAISNNEKLFLDFGFYRINQYGKWERYYNIELRGATLSAIQQHFSNDNLDTETISVRYEYILCKHLIANTEFSYLAFPADYNSLFSPHNPIVAAQQAEKQLKTLNSKGVGRLLAAGGIYNGNIEGFHDVAQQLGGDAPAGYDQVMDNKGLIIAGASVAAGLTMGRMRFPELEELEHFGARGAASGRTFDPELAGGPIEDLTTDGVNITHEGIATVEKHISRFDHDPANDVMIGRLKKIAQGGMPPEQVDLNYYTHECREFQRYCNLGWESGEPEGAAGYDLWNNAHTATLEDFKLKDGDLFHPDALK